LKVREFGTVLSDLPHLADWTRIDGSTEGTFTAKVQETSSTMPSTWECLHFNPVSRSSLPSAHCVATTCLLSILGRVLCRYIKSDLDFNSLRQVREPLNHVRELKACLVNLPSRRYREASCESMEKSECSCETLTGITNIMRAVQFNVFKGMSFPVCLSSVVAGSQLRSVKSSYI
jgi:hypothetical protein